MKYSGSGAIFKIEKNNISKFLNETDCFKDNILYSQYIWLKDIREKFPDFIPKIIEPYPNGYKMEYLKNYINLNEFIISNNININKKTEIFKKILNIILKLKTEEKYLNISKMYDFSIYIKRIKDHIEFMIKNNLNLFSEYRKLIINNVEYKAITIRDLNKIVKKLENNKNYFNSETSNCHGDFTLENILSNKLSIKLIDSNYIINGWNSWLLDISKLFQSLHHNYEGLFYGNNKFNYFEKEENLIITYNFENNKFKEQYFNYLKKYINSINLDYNMILLLEITHYIRMLKYKAAISNTDLIKSYMILSLLCHEYFKMENLN